MKVENIESSFLGLAIGDALGVPVEFKSRDYFRNNPVTTMIGYGVWNQPPGTWSDDSSMAFCLAESLTKGYDIQDIGKTFVKWMQEGYWGAHHKVFDIGGTTRLSLQRIAKGEDSLYSGEFEESSNGNGSIMRVMPASIFFCMEENETLMERMRETSGVTHRHFRSIFSCFIYSKFAGHLFRGLEKQEAYVKAMEEVREYIASKNFNPDELAFFERTVSGKLISEVEERVYSSGYVLHTLEASIWCFLNTNSYSEAVLKAVNLGGDTDTTGCVTGALAGLYYGDEGIPTEWKNVVVRKKDIIELANDFKNCMDNLILAKS